MFNFMVKHHFPLNITAEFLLVDLVDNLYRLAEDREKVLTIAFERAKSMDRDKFQEALLNYGGSRSLKFFHFFL